MNTVLIEILISCGLLLISDSLGILSSYTIVDFQKALKNAKHFLMVTGSGVSAESGIPTYRSVGGLWRNESIEKLATTQSFCEDPSTVWEFYHYRRELVLKRKPNAAHFAIAECERWLKEQGSNFTLITSNVDGMHTAAGSQNVIEIHGSLFETKCTKCNHVERNLSSPICEALKGKEHLFFNKFSRSTVPVEKLPHCKKCGGLLRPNVIWYNENLDQDKIQRAWDVLENVDLAGIAGLSSYVLPIGIFGSYLIKKGVIVAEFNIQKGPYTDTYSLYFKGPATDVIPRALNKHWETRVDRRLPRQQPLMGNRSRVFKTKTLNETLFPYSYVTNEDTFSVFSRNEFKNELNGIHPSREESFDSSDPEL